MNPRARLFSIAAFVAGFAFVVAGVAITFDAGIALAVAGALLLVAGVDMIR